MHYYNVKHLIAPLLESAPPVIVRYTQEFLRNLSIEAAKMDEAIPRQYLSYSYNHESSYLVHIGYAPLNAAFIAAFRDFRDRIYYSLYGAKMLSRPLPEQFLFITERMFDQRYDEERSDFACIKSAIKWLSNSSYSFVPYAMSELELGDDDISAYYGYIDNSRAMKSPLYGMATLKDQSIASVVVNDIEPNDIPKSLVGAIKDVQLIWT